MKIKAHSVLPLLCVAVLMTGACRDELFKGGARLQDTGGVRARVVVPDNVLIRGLGGNYAHVEAPLELVSFRATVSAADIDPSIVRDFPLGTATGEIDGVPDGSDRTFTIEGLAASGTPFLSGAATGLIIQPSQVTDAGTIVLGGASLWGRFLWGVDVWQLAP